MFDTARTPQRFYFFRKPKTWQNRSNPVTQSYRTPRGQPAAMFDIARTPQFFCSPRRNVIRITLRAKFALAGELNSRQSRELNYLAFGSIAKFAPAEQANEQIAVGNLNNSNRRSRFAP